MKSNGSRKELMKNIWMCIILRRRNVQKEVKGLEQKIENLTAEVEAAESDIKALKQEKS